MLSICICDDDTAFLTYFQRILKKCLKELKIEASIRSYTKASQLLFELEDFRQMTDIFFLDVLLQEENGIDVAKEIRKTEDTAQIIFFSMNKEYVFDAFDVMPLQYLLKERLDEAQLKEVLERAESLVEKNRKKQFIYKKGHTLRQMPLNKIKYFEVVNRQIIIHGVEEKEEYYSTMEQVEKEVEHEGFLRVHRSYLINMEKIDRIEEKMVYLFDGTEIPLGAKYVENIKTYFHFLLSKM
jgi:DNA-binding LytR/AlgR family response regulator